MAVGRGKHVNQCIENDKHIVWLLVKRHVKRHYTTNHHHHQRRRQRRRQRQRQQQQQTPRLCVCPSNDIITILWMVLPCGFLSVRTRSSPLRVRASGPAICRRQRLMDLKASSRPSLVSTSLRCPLHRPPRRIVRELNRQFCRGLDGKGWLML